MSAPRCVFSRSPFEDELVVLRDRDEEARLPATEAAGRAAGATAADMVS